MTIVDEAEIDVRYIRITRQDDQVLVLSSLLKYN